MVWLENVDTVPPQDQGNVQDFNFHKVYSKLGKVRKFPGDCFTLIAFNTQIVFVNTLTKRKEID